MGDSITEGTIASIEKNVGDGVAVDEVVATIDTDKVSVEVRSDVAGVVQALAVGGSFLQGHKLVVEPLSGQITWDGVEILGALPSVFSEEADNGNPRGKSEKKAPSLNFPRWPSPSTSS